MTNINSSVRELLAPEEKRHLSFIKYACVAVSLMQAGSVVWAKAATTFELAWFVGAVGVILIASLALTVVAERNWEAGRYGRMFLCVLAVILIERTSIQLSLTAMDSREVSTVRQETLDSPEYKEAQANIEQYNADLVFWKQVVANACAGCRTDREQAQANVRTITAQRDAERVRRDGLKVSTAEISADNVSESFFGQSSTDLWKVMAWALSIVPHLITLGSARVGLPSGDTPKSKAKPASRVTRKKSRARPKLQAV